jgi:hypothetical protein
MEDHTAIQRRRCKAGQDRGQVCEQAEEKADKRLHEADDDVEGPADNG